MYSTYKKRKSVVAERFMRTLKNKVYKYITSTSKNMYVDKLDDIVNKYNNAYYRTIKMKAVDLKLSTYIDFNKENDKENPKFEVDDHVKTSKHKSIFAKDYVSNWSKEVFVTEKVKNTVPWTYNISDLNGKEIAGTFYAKELQKINQDFRAKQVIKRKSDKLDV